MASAIHHAESSARKWGGRPEDYLAIHEWFDNSKNHHPDFRHRAMHHHSQGIEQCEQVHGHRVYLHNEDGSPLTRPGTSVRNFEPYHKWVPTKWVAEQHVIEDMGRIPTVSEWLSQIQALPWMSAHARRLSRELEV